MFAPARRIVASYAKIAFREDLPPSCSRFVEGDKDSLAHSPKSSLMVEVWMLYKSD